MARQAHFERIAAHVAKQLREERLRQGLSMNALAEKSGLSQQMVSYLERGLRKASLDTALRIAYALNVDLGQLISQAIRKSRS